MVCGKQWMVMTAGVMALAATLVSTSAWSGGGAPDPASVARGRHLVQAMSCNDCHTPGFSESEGKVGEKQWLTGVGLGFQGGWGTTYPINVRLFTKALSEDQWVQIARTAKARPPMPYYALHALSEQELRDMYRFIVSLSGPAGEPAPAYVPPGQKPVTPVVRYP